MSLRLYLEQLKREFREGSRAPDKDQIIRDLEALGKTIAFTKVSVHYIKWLWFLKCSKYTPAVQLYKMVLRYFKKTDDFFKQLSHVWSEASDGIHHPLDSLTAEEIKTGLKALGFESKRMFLAVDVLF